MWAFRARPTVRRRRFKLGAQARAVALAFPAVGARRGTVAGMPLPLVRRRPPASFSSRTFDRPLVLRSLFVGAAADPLDDVVAMLAAPTLDEAAATGERLLSGPWTDAQAAALRRVRAVALGHVAVSALWGEDAAADALRLRLLRRPTRTQFDAVVWGRFLKWAGERLAEAPLSTLPPALARAAAAALAAARGYRGAFEMLAARGSLPAGFGEPLTLMALRCSLAGTFLPALVGHLMPRGRGRRRDETGRGPWSVPLLAWRAYREHGAIAGLVHLTAALVATDVRERLLTFADRETAPALRRRWWSSPREESDRSLTGAVRLLRAGGQALTTPAPGPWPREWGGPDTSQVIRGVERMLGLKAAPLALEVFLDDRLTVAALFAVAGFQPSAEAQLAEADVPPALAEAHRALAAGLAASPARADPLSALPALPSAAAADRLFQRLRSTPEPSIELASPHWLLGETRGLLMSRLVAEGRFEAARAVRPVLDRADLRRDLEPYWILRGTLFDLAAMTGLALWLGDRTARPPGRGEWVRFAEDACRGLAAAGA